MLLIFLCIVIKNHWNYESTWQHLYTFTFMHLADTFIQSNLHCIQVTVFFFYIWSALAFPGNRTHDLGVASAMLLPFELQESTHTHIHAD